MISRLAFDVSWLGDGGGDAERASFGALTVRADDTALTRVLDLIAQTPRDSTRVSLHHLACWFADNWWRLRWEPARNERPSVAWRMAHDMSAAGGGYVWPAIRFTSDGEATRLQVRQTRELHTVQYLDEHDVFCSVETFERAIDDLLTLVLARQHGLAIVDAQLDSTWSAVLDERSDAEATSFRRREALLGLDPGELDDELLAALFERGSWIGAKALDETLAASDVARIDALLEQLLELRKRPAPRLDVQSVLTVASTWHKNDGGRESWEHGSSLAQHFRKQWALGTGPISDKFLNDLLGVDIHDAALAAPAGAPVVAFKDDARLVPALKPTHVRASRRFAIARLLADTAVAAIDDAMHPLTDCHTARQKLQRSTAQEFLCPVAALRERLRLSAPDAQKIPDDDEIADAAEYFEVSPMLITTTLVNNRLAPRTLLE